MQSQRTPDTGAAVSKRKQFERSERERDYSKPVTSLGTTLLGLLAVCSSPAASRLPSFATAKNRRARCELKKDAVLAGPKTNPKTLLRSRSLVPRPFFVIVVCIICARLRSLLGPPAGGRRHCAMARLRWIARWGC